LDIPVCNKDGDVAVCNKDGDIAVGDKDRDIAVGDNLKDRPREIPMCDTLQYWKEKKPLEPEISGNREAATYVYSTRSWRAKESHRFKFKASKHIINQASTHHLTRSRSPIYSTRSWLAEHYRFKQGAPTGIIRDVHYMEEDLAVV
jgi:hypothetical protein